MLTLVWSEEALDELDAIVEYIGHHSVAAALKLRDQVEACAERLPEHPYLYRQGRILGTREAVVHPNYILIYEVGIDAVEIRSVVHSRREYPPEDDT